MSRRLILLMLTVGLCLSSRGFMEAVESATHMVAYGHSAHEANGSKHEHSDSEHGCVGHHHVCPCCTPMPLGPPPFMAVELVFANDCQLLEDVGQRVGPPGVRAMPYKPPIS